MALVTLLTIFNGCATPTGKTIEIEYVKAEADSIKWPEDILENRFKEYWFNRFNGQIEDNYQMEYPYFQELVSQQKYRNYVHNAVNTPFIKMKVQGIRMVSDYLMVVDCMAVIKGKNDSITEISLVDRWVYTDGKWYHVIRDPLFSI
jgi:hypothetical protein